jgi:hypothetical protein
VTVYQPIYVVGHWWEQLLHNHKARRIRQKLMLVHGVTLALVPWLLDSSQLVYGRRSRPIPGQDRRGEPVRPAMRPVHRRPIGGHAGARAANHGAADAPGTVPPPVEDVSETEPTHPVGTRF